MRFLLFTLCFVFLNPSWGKVNENDPNMSVAPQEQSQVVNMNLRQSQDAAVGPQAKQCKGKIINASLLSSELEQSEGQNPAPTDSVN